MLAYVYDESLKKEYNQNRQNCWEVYIEEILGQLGACADKFLAEQLEDIDNLKDVKTLIIGNQSGEKLTDKALQNLDEWVSKGGILIGFAVKGLDRVFGINTQSIIKQENDIYSISGYFDLYYHSITKQIHSVIDKEQKLLIFSNIKIIELKNAVELGHIYDTKGKDLFSPAITWNNYGKGFAGYFAFDVAKTVWLLHQGKPLPLVPGDNFEMKACKLQVVGENSRKIPYADEIVLILQNMIALNGHQFIYQIPPDGEIIPDALFYWSGDEYFGPVKLSLGASDWMKEKGLPYHINIGIEQHENAKDGHPMTKEEYKHIRDNGHEISLWYSLPSKNGQFSLTEEKIEYQTNLFYERFGHYPGCVLLNSTNWQGWADPARWLAKSGAKADNTFNGTIMPGDHPLYNSSFYGFGYGTSFPFYFYDNYEYGNERINLIEEPIICYELGHRGSIVPYDDKDSFIPEEVHPPIDMAVKHHMVMNFFYHPYYITQYPLCRKAIEEILNYIEYKKAFVMHMGNNQVCEWWNARSKSRTTSINNQNSISFISDCAYSAGMIVKTQLNGITVTKVMCDDALATFKIVKEYGGQWLYVVVPFGNHKISVE